MISIRRIVLILVAVAWASSGTAWGGFVVPNAYASTAGPTLTFGIFGNGSTSSFTEQFGYSASQFASASPGTPITSIGFRLPAGAATFTGVLSFSQFNIQIGKAAQPIGSFSTNFADNEGADTITARSGALTIPGGSLVGGPGPNPFFDISFAKPYIYTGGDLAITIRSVLTSASQRLAVDAVIAGVVTDSVVAPDAAATASTDQGVNVPVIQLGTTAAAVPEPSSLALCGIAILVGLVHARARGVRVTA